MSSIFFSNRLKCTISFGNKADERSHPGLPRNALVKFLYRIHGAVTALQLGTFEPRSR